MVVNMARQWKAQMVQRRDAGVERTLLTKVGTGRVSAPGVVVFSADAFES